MPYYHPNPSQPPGRLVYLLRRLREILSSINFPNSFLSLPWVVQLMRRLKKRVLRLLRLRLFGGKSLYHRPGSRLRCSTKLAKLANNSNSNSEQRLERGLGLGFGLGLLFSYAYYAAFSYLTSTTTRISKAKERMPFPFTFKLSVPGLSNPFSSPPMLSPHPRSSAGAGSPEVGDFGYGDGDGDIRGARSRDLAGFEDGADDADVLNLCAASFSTGASTSGTGFPSSLTNPNRNLRGLSPSLQRQRLGLRQGQPQQQQQQRVSRKRGWEPEFDRDMDLGGLGARRVDGTGTGTGYQSGSMSFDPPNATATANAHAQDPAQPPAKRRRGLAGSIVSTALHAALIGTAVGLTVYRLWRDRGKEPDKIQTQIITDTIPSSPPPPPYSSSDPRSAPVPAPAPVAAPNVNVIPPTPRGRRVPRAVHAGVSPGSVGRKRPPRVRGGYHHKTHSISSFGPQASGSGSVGVFPPTQPAFDFESTGTGVRDKDTLCVPAEPQEGEEVEEVEDQMDWIGDKLAMLIAEGKKALGREVVVMSEVEEDEVDDGSGAWVDQDQEEGERGARAGSRAGSRSGSRRREVGGGGGSSLSRSGSTASRRSLRGVNAIVPPPYYEGTLGLGSGSVPSSASPRRGQFSIGVTPVTTPRKAVGYEDENEWESPEVRESMERARAKAREVRERKFGPGVGFS